MRERSLIDRLRHREPPGERSTRLDTALLADSVLTNLNRMLNSRQGLASSAMDYGLPDLTDVLHTFPEAIDICRRSIRQSIERYEPRLRNIIVDSVADPDDPFHLRFEIRAQLVTDQQAAPVAFYTTLDASGQARVSR